jgi:hypothetical protein
MANQRHALQELLHTPELPDLGPGPRTGRTDLAALDATLQKALKDASVSEKNRELLRSTIYLWHDYLDASHTISQSMENADGSYLHGIMHRREPDYWNSKYWFRRVGQHPCFDQLASEVEKVLSAKGNKALASKLLPKGKWDPFAFVDECERVAALPKTEPQVETLREIQAIEFRVLLEHLAS